MNAQKVWKCDKCGISYESVGQAMWCCPPDVTALWKCLTCKKTYDAYDEAEECCVSQEAQKQ
jgi:hypothetical protein